MTREEAIKLVYEKIEGIDDMQNAKLIVKYIFNDFEYNRICKNCKWFEKNYCTHMKNTKMNEDTMIMVDKNFGCNRFERR